MYSVQSLSYYFYKSLAIVFLPIIILVIAGTSYFVQTSKLPPSTTFPTLASFLLFSGLVLYFNPMFINYVRVAQSTTPVATRYIQDLLIKSQDPEIYKSKNLTVFATAGESGIDPDVAVMMIRSNKPHNTCSHELLLLLRSVSPKELTSNDLNSLNCNAHQLTILAEPGDTEHILEIVRASNMHSQINVTPLQ